MATTASGLLFGTQEVALAHVGDSRVYLLRHGHLRQVTNDHSWVGEQIRAGALSDADARHHPWRNVVTRALTGGDDPIVDVEDLALDAGDRWLICSDGLSTVVPTDRIADILGAATPLGDICRELIDAANAAGGPDNITAIVLSIDVA
jgi:protein phosphatase